MPGVTVTSIYKSRSLATLEPVFAFLRETNENALPALKNAAAMGASLERQRSLLASLLYAAPQNVYELFEDGWKQHEDEVIRAELGLL